MELEVKQGIPSIDEVRSIVGRFKKSLAGGDLFIFTIGDQEFAVVDVAPMASSSGSAPSTLVLMVWGRSLDEILGQVSGESGVKIRLLPRIDLPTSFEGYSVNRMEADR